MAARGSTLAAVVAGIPILVGFFAWHWFNIAPVWGVLIEAAIAFPVAVLGVAWAWRLSRHAYPRAHPWDGLAFGAVFAGGLVISEIIGLARGRGPTAMSGTEVGAEVLLASVPVIPIALLGWRVARDRRGALAYGLAALPLDLHLGGTVMHLGGTGIALLLFAILLPAYLAAGVLLAALEPRFTSREP